MHHARLQLIILDFNLILSQPTPANMAGLQNQGHGSESLGNGNNKKTMYIYILYICIMQNK